MSNLYDTPFGASHDHVFLGVGHEKNERKTWAVIVLCTLMMAAEIIGGSMFGSLALVADGLHMSTHAGAMLIAALAYTYARRHANDPRFVFGTGKLGDLAGFTSAIILAMIALLIGYEAVVRFLSPVPIHFSEAIPIAIVGLLVNIASAWLLSGGDHGGHSHGHSHHHGHAHGHDHDAAGLGDTHPHGKEVQHIDAPAGVFALSIFEEGVPPVFRLAGETAPLPGDVATVTTFRPDGSRQEFLLVRKANYLESTTEIPEPHAFTAVLGIGGQEYSVDFEEHDHDHADGHGAHHRDHNMRAAYVHVLADAAVSVLAIVGLLLARAFGWLWMDPLAGVVGALVIANWAYGLMRDTGGILVDMTPDKHIGRRIKTALESDGDTLLDLHVWRIGPGHLGAVVSVSTGQAHRGPQFYHQRLRRLQALSHITVEVHALPGN
ncbi:CDF family Co(II)/Ni(II) efflux transporter DmeF [Ralstonia flatus]|uniref:Zinc transporter ZitB n=1 Tax=Ralstonia flatus TaxID=3058601 RepID=A0AAD2C174_9RALS|nr:CDF family Co(II)/Ni(II) efflux transporter DmeF [Ralstonia sp. LMG 32965]CAJ0885526.1 Zinc transporter ZitB [Ralstonia sp. LMG 32965]CAJ0890089.1 Zinc transporter ZitB [Ralstonia sp. LMG 32965]